jgi:hypothetical protein
MIPQNLQPLFWDVNIAKFDPRAYPEYTIFRVLEYGDDQAVRWMRELFSEAEIQKVVRTEARLSPKSANFWALIYGIRHEEVAAFTHPRPPIPPRPPDDTKVSSGQ